MLYPGFGDIFNFYLGTSAFSIPSLHLIDKNLQERNIHDNIATLSAAKTLRRYGPGKPQLNIIQSQWW